MRIFFENKFFFFTSEADFVAVGNTISGGRQMATLRLEPGVTPSPEQLLEVAEGYTVVTIVAPDAEELFARFCASLPTVRAAGGVVENESGSVLMMTRKGWPDLPKGHIEEGETDEQAAIREVLEETGLSEVEIVTHLCTTRHIHNAYGRWEIKQTEWYLMFAPGEEPELSPETEEQITAVEWLRGRRLWQAVDKSYSTIKLVFEKFIEYKVQ